MRVVGFATVRLCVKSVKESRDWYRTFFGLEPVEDLENFASFRIGGVVLDLVTGDEKNPYSFGGAIPYWQVDDLERALDHATSLGAKTYRGPLDVPELRRRIAQFQDPFGNVIGLEAAY